jgi:phosphate starvation-inducible PhoH-like protein
LKEKLIDLTGINLIDLFGAEEKRLKVLKDYFPKLKIVLRGNELKIIGDDIEIARLTEKLELFIQHIDKYQSLTIGNMESIMEEGAEVLSDSSGDEVLVHGNGGMRIKAKTVNQRRMVAAIDKDDMLFAIGPAGTGKTYTAVALAVRALKQREIKRIILTRPAVEAGEHLGFLPGDLKEKLDPYLQPLYDALRDMIPPQKLESYLENGDIQIAPLAFMRGRTLDNAFVILDEAQNATQSQMKMFLTRMGKSAKFVITGDVTQIDLPKKEHSGLEKTLYTLKDIKGISIVHLSGSDVIRHHLVKKIIKAFEG